MFGRLSGRGCCRHLIVGGRLRACWIQTELGAALSLDKGSVWLRHGDRIVCTVGHVQCQ